MSQASTKRCSRQVMIGFGAIEHTHAQRDIRFPQCAQNLRAIACCIQYTFPVCDGRSQHFVETHTKGRPHAPRLTLGTDNSTRDSSVQSSLSQTYNQGIPRSCHLHSTFQHSLFLQFVSNIAASCGFHRYTSQVIHH